MSTQTPRSRALSDRRLRIGRRLEVYIAPGHIWVGAFVHKSAVYVMFLPCLVIRWDRANTGGTR